MKKIAWFLGAAIMGAVAIFGSGPISTYINQNTNLVQNFFGFLGALGVLIGFFSNRSGDPTHKQKIGVKGDIEMGDGGEVNIGNRTNTGAPKNKPETENQEIRMKGVRMGDNSTVSIGNTESRER